MTQIEPATAVRCKCGHRRTSHDRRDGKVGRCLWKGVRARCRCKQYQQGAGTPSDAAFVGWIVGGGLR